MSRLTYNNNITTRSVSFSIENFNMKRRNEIAIPGSLNVGNGKLSSQIFAQMSDERLKTNITDIVDALKMVNDMKGYYYKWKERDDDTVVGFLAQELKEISPEVRNIK